MKHSDFGHGGHEYEGLLPSPFFVGTHGGHGGLGTHGSWVIPLTVFELHSSLLQSQLKKLQIFFFKHFTFFLIFPPSPLFWPSS